MSIYNILLNSSNIINNNNTYFKFKFVNGNFEINENSQMCISQIVLPYSWFNLNYSYYNNTNFSFYFGGTTLYNIQFPDGFYSTVDINNYLQQYCITNKLYKTDNATGQNVYYIYLFSNVTYYGNQFLLYPIESTAQTGYTYPSGFPFSASNYIPKLNFLSTSNFGSILGYSPGLYPSIDSSLSTSILSNITPNATPINSVVVRCNICNNDCTSPSDILDSFPINSTFGSNINYTPSYEKWINIKEGSYQNLLIYLQDQNLNQIIARDPNVLISILIKQGPEKQKKLTLNNLVPKIKSIEFKNDEENFSMT